MSNKVLFFSPQDAEQAFYRAIEAADLEAMMSVWSEDEEIVCIFPGGARLCGYIAVREAWRNLFNSGQRLRVTLSATRVIKNPFSVVVNALQHISVIGQTDARAPILVSNVFVRGPLGWRMVLHHCSPSAPPTKKGKDSAAQTTVAGDDEKKVLH